ncbi:MAG: hypothetical protein ACR2HF_08935 [Methylococcaceae bacterium]
MAIQDANATVKNPSAQTTMGQAFQQAQQAQQPYQAPPQMPPQAQPPTGFSFHSGGYMFKPMSEGLGSKYLSTLHDKIAEIYKKEMHPSVEVALINLDNTVETALCFSSLVVCTRFKARPELGVAYHILIVEATAERPAAVYQSIYNQQVEILRVTGDAMDDELYKRVLDKVTQQYPAGPYRMADACVVPMTFNLDDDSVVKRLAFNASFACTTELEVHSPDFAEINLAMARYDSTLICDVQFARQNLENSMGEPVRSDITVKFNSQRSQNQGQQDQRQIQSLNAGNRQTNLSGISGFIDTVYAPLAPMNTYNFYQPQAYNTPTQRYVARFVITDIMSEMRYTPASILLWLATAIGVRDDNNWILALRPSPNKEGIDLYDIGALNIDANLENNPQGFGSRIDTRTGTQQPSELGQLITSLYRQGLIISLDVPDCGPQTWYLHVFKEAEMGNPNAIDIILNAANTLTNGRFSTHFQPGHEIFTDKDNRIHTGYYVDSAGMKKDIRAIDYLAVCNLIGEKDPNQIRIWSDTFYRTEVPLISRLAQRKKLIQGLTHEAAVFTGFAQRVTFSTEFMQALVKGCLEAGLRVRINTPTSVADINQQRGIGGFVNEALLMPTTAIGQSFMDRSYGYQPVVYGHQATYNRF